MKVGQFVIFFGSLVLFGSWVAIPNTTKNAGWLTVEEALELQQKEPKKWMVDVYTNWCGWCRRMDETTFQDDKILEALDKHYYKVRLNAEYKKTIKVGEKEYRFVNEGRRGHHELAFLFLEGKMSYPTLVFITEEMQIIQPVSGYKSAQDLHPILQYIGEDHYKTKEYPTFQETYKSPYIK